MIGGWRVLFSFNRNTRLYLLAWGMGAFGFLGLQGVLLNLYLLRLGYGIEFIGLLIASGQVAWAAVALPAGYLGQRLGLRRVLIAGHGILALGFALFLMVESLPAPLRGVGLFGSWILFWSGGALNTVNSAPYLMAITHEDERSYAFSTQAAVIAGMAFAGSMAAGFLPEFLAGMFGGTLDGPSVYRQVLWLAPVAYLLGMVAYVASAPVKQTEKAVGEFSLRPPLKLFVMLSLVAFMQASAIGAVRAFFNVYLDTELLVSTAQIGSIMGAGQLVPVVVALITPAILGKWGVARALALISAVMGLAMIPLAVIPIWQAAAVGFMGVVSLWAVEDPARKIFNQEIVETRWRSTTSAIDTVGVALGWAVMSALGGYLMPIAGFGGPILLGAAFTMGSSIVVLAYVRSATSLAAAEGTD